MCSGAGGYRILRDGRVGGGRAGESIRNRGEDTSGKTGAAKRKTEATATTAAQKSDRRQEPTTKVSSEGAGGE